MQQDKTLVDHPTTPAAGHRHPPREAETPHAQRADRRDDRVSCNAASHQRRQNPMHQNKTPVDHPATPAVGRRHAPREAETPHAQRADRLDDRVGRNPASHQRRQNPMHRNKTPVDHPATPAAGHRHPPREAETLHAQRADRRDDRVGRRAASHQRRQNPMHQNWTLPNHPAWPAPAKADKATRSPTAMWKCSGPMPAAVKDYPTRSDIVRRTEPASYVSRNETPVRRYRSSPPCCRQGRLAGSGRCRHSLPRREACRCPFARAASRPGLSQPMNSASRTAPTSRVQGNETPVRRLSVANRPGDPRAFRSG